MKNIYLLLVVFLFVACTRKDSAGTTVENTGAAFTKLSEEQLARNLGTICVVRLAMWYGKAPPKSLDLSGKKAKIQEMPPIISKEFDQKFYEFQRKLEELKSAKSFEAAKEREVKLSEDFEQSLAKTKFYQTCQKITKKVAAACVKNQASEEELKKCALFYQDKFDILDRHNSHIMEIVELRDKAIKNAKWLDE